MRCDHGRQLFMRLHQHPDLLFNVRIALAAPGVAEDAYFFGPYPCRRRD